MTFLPHLLSQIVRNMGLKFSHFCDLCQRTQFVFMSFALSYMMTLFYQIDLYCKEGENGGEKVCFSGNLDLFSWSRIHFMKIPKLLFQSIIRIKLK